MVLGKLHAMYPEMPDSRPPSGQFPSGHQSSGQLPSAGEWFPAAPPAPAPPPVAGPVYPSPVPYGYVPVPVPVGQYPPVVVVGSEKSVGVALVLSFFFGPLGMFYSTVTGGLVMLGVYVLAALLSIVTVGIPLFLAWIGCMVWACTAANEHNNRVRAQLVGRCY
ncbi:MAG TPA: hypothetical protein DIW80_04300 [Gordonia polyisoprenivorans]|nr:hypothetical protein [Gordonia polyisoprenivorans]OZC33515.1 hypothetical protein CJJ17_19975 [Gordonia polyisoprenivorans]QUD82235.1 hypothetical protein J8M97_21350 [Gordonia polyisoprenivorans]HCS56577.1 hypothetical protein [Gordonia polyisoprenivorans]